ncbi:MAG TPA: TetR family transcriptional regulator [Actinomycetes bacterium]
MYSVQERISTTYTMYSASVNTSRPKTKDAARLSPDTLVDAAIALADEHGLEALTIRRLAAEIGVTAMAPYWHFKDKEELLEALGERMFAEVELPPAQDRPWQAEIGDALRAVLGVLRRHPALAPLARHTILSTESGFLVAERVLSLLSQAGFDDSATADTGTYLLSSIVTLVTAQPGLTLAAHPDERDRQMQAKRARLALVPADRFPSVARLAGALIDCQDPEAYYRRGLDLLVLGLQTLATTPAR